MVPAYKAAKYPLILVSDSGIKSMNPFIIFQFVKSFIFILCMYNSHLFSEGGHADRHGGRHEGGRGACSSDALHLRQCGPPIHTRKGNNYIRIILCCYGFIFHSSNIKQALNKHLALIILIVRMERQSCCTRVFQGRGEYSS